MHLEAANLPPRGGTELLQFAQFSFLGALECTLGRGFHARTARQAACRVLCEACVLVISGVLFVSLAVTFGYLFFELPQK